jgi:hypothetical protein
MRIKTGAVLSVVLVVVLVCSSARAAFDEFAIGAKAGTLGLGGDITTDLIPQVNLRAGVQWLDFGFDAQLGDVDYTLDLNFLNPLVLVDWYPFKGSFRISGGVLFNGTEIHLKAQSGQSIEIDGTTYTQAQIGTLRGDVDYRPVAPYVGIGWGNQLGKEGHWGLATDLGVAFTGSPSVDLSATGPIAADPTFQTQLAQQERDIQDKLDPFKFYPVLSISLFYRF